MIPSIHIDQARFLADLMSKHFEGITYGDVVIAAEEMPVWKYRNLLRLYYNGLMDQCRHELVELVRSKVHRISTVNAQYGDEDSDLLRKLKGLA